MKTLLLIALFLSGTATAFAEQTGWYLGLGLGAGASDISKDTYDDGSVIIVKQFDIEGTSFAPSFFVGHRLTEYISLEVSYLDFGEYGFKGTSDGTGTFWFPGDIEVTEKAKGYTLALIGYLPLGRRHIFNITGKAGFLKWDAEVKLKDSWGTITEEDDGTDFFVGIGVNFDFFKKGSIRIDIDRYKIDFLNYDRVIAVGSVKYVHYF
ncbi:MAG TPA: porin family protein [candidate division Zixibacteria bacterium]|nr:porin family protein [candidate division Zixibacteria bacterium]